MADDITKMYLSIYEIYFKLKYIHFERITTKDFFLLLCYQRVWHRVSTHLKPYKPKKHSDKVLRHKPI